MNKVYLTLKMIRSNETIDVIFDEKLSFKENFELLKEIKDIETGNMYIYDPFSHLYLKDDIPIRSYNLNNHMYFEVY